MKISNVFGLTLIAGLATACTQPQPNPTPAPGPVDYSIVMGLRDLTTNYPRLPRETDEHGLVFSSQSVYPNIAIEEFEREHLEAWQRSIRVVTWPEREPVAGHWEVRTEPWRIAFVQDGPFTERWYAMQINLSTLPAALGIWHDEAPQRGLSDHSVIDGWVTSRFHVGSAALVTVVGVWDADSNSGTFGIRSTEPVFSRSNHAANQVVSITADGRPLRCEPTVAEFSAGTAIEAGWSCFGEVATSDDLEVTLLVDDLATAEGRRARICAEGTPARWISEPGAVGDYQAIISGNRCPDSAFVAETVEGL